MHPVRVEGPQAVEARQTGTQQQCTYSDITLLNKSLKLRLTKNFKVNSSKKEILVTKCLKLNTLLPGFQKDAVLLIENLKKEF